MTRLIQNELSKYVNKFVKVIYKEHSKPQVARGVLVGFDSDFVNIKGDYSTMLISIKNIDKVKIMENQW